ncbi:MAG: hypothetical protein JWN13_3619 [Betaproteobacteria bacterium]|nr:hypothetical protein [Betaproteobacteria bacterium]
MSGLSRTPGKRVYGESRTAGSNPALSATYLFDYTYKSESVVPSTGKSLANPEIAQAEIHAQKVARWSQEGPSV